MPKQSPKGPQWRERRQHSINANQNHVDRPCDAQETCSKLAVEDSGRLWRFSHVHSELWFWLLRRALMELQKKEDKPLYPCYIMERIVLETVFFCLVFFRTTCRLSFIFGLHLFVGGMQCYCAVLEYTEKVRGRQTMKIHSFLYCICKQDVGPHHSDQRRFECAYSTSS